jgi:hypothetical protein
MVTNDPSLAPPVNGRKMNLHSLPTGEGRARLIEMPLSCQPFSVRGKVGGLLLDLSSQKPYPV